MSFPLMIFDGDCNFCKKWIAYWRQLTGSLIQYSPFQSIASQFPQIPEKKFQQSVCLVLEDQTFCFGAEAIFRALSLAGKGKGWYWCYRFIPGFKWVSELGYWLVARLRPLFSVLTTVLWGSEISTSRFQFSSWLFLRFLGVIYFIAFASLGGQILGLVGQEGIIPAGSLLQAVKEAYGVSGYGLAPTLFWFNSSDPVLLGMCYAGAIVAILLVIGFVPVFCLSFLFIAYLSLLTVASEFLSFQWDILLLEVGFFSIFLAGFHLLPKVSSRLKSSSLMVWIFRLLLFRLVFFSGVVKLLSQDVSWRNLSALTYHFETQPLPNSFSWYIHQLPEILLKFATFGTFVVELIVPFLFLLPRRTRHIGALITILFQLSIIVTGNYCFFNLLTIGLCLFLVDDRFWSRQQQGETDKKLAKGWPRSVLVPLFCVVLIFSSFQLVRLFDGQLPRILARPLVQMNKMIAPFRILNSYGLFAVMTTKRPEIVIEGSRDGSTWKEYTFKYKPSALDAAPSFVMPHQPRLDWQMWFAALSNYENNPWFLNLCYRLLQGSPKVLALLENNPFPDEPPQYVRALRYEYEFADKETHKKTGEWWQRRYRGIYTPVLPYEG